MNRARPFLPLLVALLVGCGGSGVTHSRPNFSVLTAEEMQAGQYGSVYDAVLALRSNWLRERPPSDYLGEVPERAEVFQDGLRVGTAEYLRQLPVRDVEAVRYLTVAEAATEFGRQANAVPVIAITMKRGP